MDRLGLKVHVWSANQEEYWGIGEITKVEPLIIEETGETLSEQYPSEITLENGKKTEGMLCWWSPVTDAPPIEPRGKDGEGQ